jgi:hypothetical protein
LAPPVHWSLYLFFRVFQPLSPTHLGDPCHVFCPSCGWDTPKARQLPVTMMYSDAIFLLRGVASKFLSGVCYVCHLLQLHSPSILPQAVRLALFWFRLLHSVPWKVVFLSVVVFGTLLGKQLPVVHWTWLPVVHYPCATHTASLVIYYPWCTTWCATRKIYTRGASAGAPHVIYTCGELMHQGNTYVTGMYTTCGALGDAPWVYIWFFLPTVLVLYIGSILYYTWLIKYLYK